MNSYTAFYQCSLFFLRVLFFGIQTLELNHKYNIQYHIKEFSDELINEVNKSNVLDIKTCAGKKGDLIIFDGSGIHRGKPLNENHRYAITHYYRFDPDEIMPFKKINNCLKK